MKCCNCKKKNLKKFLILASNQLAVFFQIKKLRNLKNIL